MTVGARWEFAMRTAAAQPDFTRKPRVQDSRALIPSPWNRERRDAWLQRQRMAAGREAQRGILCEQTLMRCEAAEGQLLMGVVQRQLELPAAPAVHGARGLGWQPETDLP